MPVMPSQNRCKSASLFLRWNQNGEKGGRFGCRLLYSAIKNALFGTGRCGGRLNDERIAHPQSCPGVSGWDGSVHGKSVEMVKAFHAGPGWKIFPSEPHEFFLKFRDRFAADRIARGHHAALARIVAQEIHDPNLKRF